MAALPMPTNCPTLDAVDREIEARQDRSRRGYLGMSSIGKSCERALWLSFRWAFSTNFKAQTLKLFDDGHRGEDIQAERLRLVPTIELLTHDEDGQQFGFSDFGGHFKGHMDGGIKGILQAPKTWHVWEHKQTAEKKQAKLEKLKAENEKAALEQWDYIYFAQGILYMHYSGMTRHYLTAASPGGRHTIAVRTNADDKVAIQLKTKAQRIIKANTLPEGISDSPAYYECKWCDYYMLCHGKAIPQVNCRTCVHSTPNIDGEGGEWTCARLGRAIDRSEQEAACEYHLFIPALLRNHAEAVDADADTLKWVEYQRPDGSLFRTGFDGIKSFDLGAAL